MHPLFAGLNQNPWSTMPTRDTVGRHFYGAKIPRGAPASPFAMRTVPGLGGVEDYANDSSAALRAKIRGFQDLLANAQRERRGCDESSIALKILNPAGFAACILKWDGQVGWWKDRLAEANAALHITLAKEQADAAQAAADSADVQSATATTGSGVVPGINHGGGITKGARGASTAAKSSFAQYLPIGIAVLAIGVVGYTLLKR